MLYKTKDQIRFGADITVMEEIPKGNWLLCQEEATKEFYLQKTEDFKIPIKIYGKEEEIALRYLKTFNKLDQNIGILLTGLKGNGKSLTAKLVCELSDLPVILITQPFTGELFQSFIGSMTQRVIVFVDEFEKVYSDEEGEQEEFLPILDGVFEASKLFLFTSNSMKINKFLKNRPGRIRYLRKYDGLDKDVIKEVIQDKLENKEHESALMELIALLSNISMDVLLHIIEEMNIYGETPLESVRMLNVQVEHSTFDVLLFYEGKRHVTKIQYNPLVSKYIWIEYREENSRGEIRWRNFSRETSEFDIQTVDGEFVFTTLNDNTKIIFTPSKETGFSL